MATVTSKLDSGKLTIYLGGRIDTASSAEVEEGIKNEKEGQPYGEIVVDFSGVEYISSSGLRIILHLKKDDKNVSIVEVSPDVYSVFEMTGFTEMMPITKALRKISIDGCVEIGHGAKGIVYRYNPDTIVKVYRNASDVADAVRERELARKAFVLGVPTAISFDIVRVGDSYGSMFELLDCASLTKEINDAAKAGDDAKFDELVSIYATLLRDIHQIEVDDSIPDRKIKMIERLEKAKEFLGDDYEAIKKLIDNVPVSSTLLHCDCHTNNIMYMNGEALLIDMDTLSRGNVVFELADIYTAYVGFGETDPAMVEKFMGVDFDLAKKIWDAFLPKYLAGSDGQNPSADFVKEQENKIKLLSYLRIINHYAKRKEASGELGEKAIADAHEKIKELLPKISTLVM